VKFRPCVPGCFAPATAARPCHGHAAAGLHGYAIPRGGCVGAGSTGYAPAYVQIPATRLATPAREFAHFSSFFFQFFFFKTLDVLVCAAYTRTTSPLRWMHWHARCIHQDCIPAPLDALECPCIHQDRICVLFYFIFKQTCARAFASCSVYRRSAHCLQVIFFGVLL
jgi:hypothetical protein